MKGEKKKEHFRSKGKRERTQEEGEEKVFPEAYLV